MSSFAPSLDGLTAGQVDDVARHLEQSYHLNYGFLERQEQMVFRVGAEETQRTEPPAVFLRELSAAVRAGGPVSIKVPRGKPDQYRISELLGQSANRAAREVAGRYGTEAASTLALWTRAWDDTRRLSSDELERAEWITMPGQQAAPQPVGRIIG